MRSPLPASSSSNDSSLLIAAISGRALAAAARRAGYRPLVADLFCDTDTVALAARTLRIAGDLHSGIEAGPLLEALERLAEDETPCAVVLGSGFERRPVTIEAVASRFPVAGNGAATIRRVKDPAMFAADCAELGIPHPEIRCAAPPDPENWMVKRAGAAGGAHVRRANGAVLPRDGYFQRAVAGESISALFVADGSTAHIVGFSRQWAAAAPDAPYRYGGAVRLRRFDRQQAAAIGGWLSGLTRRAGLVGLCSADLIRDGDRCWLVEINPRPGATLDIFDSADAPLIEAHLRASRGDTFRLPRFDDCMASSIVYADRPIERFPALDWPDWTADHQSPGTRLAAGDPVCTAFARAPTAAAALKAIRGQVHHVGALWQEALR